MLGCYYKKPLKIFGITFSILMTLEPCIKLWSAIENILLLNVQSCKLYNNKYMITSKQIRITENFAFVAVLVSAVLVSSYSCSSY